MKEKTLSGKDVSTYKFEALEFAIGHVVGTQVSRVYDRSDYLGDRTELMQDWADYLVGKRPLEEASLEKKAA